MKKHLNVKTAVHSVMLSFSAASLANVESVFAHLYTGVPLLSWGLGVALGIGLVVLAALLSGMVWDWRDPRFQVVAGATAALALLSGGIQAAAYSQHMTSKFAAIVVGLSLPVVGELLVALAVSAYTQAQRRQRMTDAQTQLSDGVRAQIGEAISAIDKSKIEAQVNRAATLVTRAIVDSTIEDMLADLRKNKDNDGVNLPSNDGENLTPAPEITTNNDEINDIDGNFAERMQDAKRKKSEVRQRNLLEILGSEFNGVSAEELNKTELGKRLGVTRQTVTNDLNALAESGDITLNGIVKVN